MERKAVAAEDVLRNAAALAREQAAGTRRRGARHEDDATARQLERASFEERVHHSRQSAPLWLRYAAYELGLGEAERARSVFERALAVLPYTLDLYLRYAALEVRLGRIGAARNVFDRAVALLPLEQEHWFRYAAMEEAHGSAESARAVWDRWLRWAPAAREPWLAAARFEERHGSPLGVRSVYARMARAHAHSAEPYLLLARYEEHTAHDVPRARRAFETALFVLDTDEHRDALDASFIVAFARFEAALGEVERARQIYAHGIRMHPSAPGLRHSSIAFERRLGNADRGDAVLRAKLASRPTDWDTWLALARLFEAECDDASSDVLPARISAVRDVYEEALKHAPAEETKDAWRRYVWVWVAYAVFEETKANDRDRAGEVYARLLRAIPHARFSFSKAWVLAAQLYVRRRDLAAARRTFGRALGVAPRPAVFRAYISLEEGLREFARVRTIREKFACHAAWSAEAWTGLADFEALLGNYARARAVFEAAVSLDTTAALAHAGEDDAMHTPAKSGSNAHAGHLPHLGTRTTLIDNPRAVWRAWIEFEREAGSQSQLHGLFLRMLERFGRSDVATWLLWARTQHGVASELVDDTHDVHIVRMRRVFKDAIDAVPASLRAIVQDEWKALERDLGSWDRDVCDGECAHDAGCLCGAGRDVVAGRRRANVSNTAAENLLAAAALWKSVCE